MKVQITVSFCFLTLIGSLSVSHAIVAPPTYTQPASVIDSGGGVSTSPGYENLGAIGQPIVGLSIGAGGNNHAGFIPVLGAYGILWPVIGFDPASFTFTFFIGDPAPAGQGLNLANAGGSSLEWQVARTSTWLSLIPMTGTNSGAVTVGILTAGLTPGVHTDTITISADGAENSGVTIPVTLTVGVDYTLTVTFASPTIPKGGGYVAFNPAPTVGATTCTGEPCKPKYRSGTPVAVTVYPDNDSLFSFWSGACSGGSCSITMSADRAVTATFSFVKPAMIVETAKLYDTLQLAYNAALTGQTIRAREFTFVEDLTLGEAKGVTIKGGFDTKYSTQNGYSLLKGKLTVVKGSLVTERLTVK
jgi:hypothetical protein